MLRRDPTTPQPEPTQLKEEELQQKLLILMMEAFRNSPARGAYAEGKARHVYFPPGLPVEGIVGWFGSVDSKFLIAPSRTLLMISLL
jgi:hypothetical protein